MSSFTIANKLILQILVWYTMITRRQCYYMYTC